MSYEAGRADDKAKIHTTVPAARWQFWVALLEHCFKRTRDYCVTRARALFQLLLADEPNVAPQALDAASRLQFSCGLCDRYATHAEQLPDPLLRNGYFVARYSVK